MNKCTYTALGDSLTNGIFAYIFDGFAFRIARYYRCKYHRFCFNNFGVDGYTSKDLFNQLYCCSNIQKCIQKSNFITITIGGNDLLPSIRNNCRKINVALADKALKQFNYNWLNILKLLRENLCFNGEIYTMTLYNPYSFHDPNYKLAKEYLLSFNNIIEDSETITDYCYNVVDMYTLFNCRESKHWTFFNTPFRNPHPNFEGNYVISKSFINTIDM